MTKAQIRTLDRFVREQMRKRGRCEKCGTRSNLQVSHIYSRRYISIRHHPLNMFLLCAGDHLLWHHKPTEAVEWAKKKLGEAKWRALKQLADNIGAGKVLSPEQVKAWWG